jgi:hypothetical protein
MGQAKVAPRNAQPIGDPDQHVVGDHTAPANDLGYIRLRLAAAKADGALTEAQAEQALVDSTEVPVGQG